MAAPFQHRTRQNGYVRASEFLVLFYVVYVDIYYVEDLGPRSEEVKAVLLRFVQRFAKSVKNDSNENRYCKNK